MRACVTIYDMDSRIVRCGIISKNKNRNSRWSTTIAPAFRKFGKLWSPNRKVPLCYFDLPKIDSARDFEQF